MPNTKTTWTREDAEKARDSNWAVFTSWDHKFRVGSTLDLVTTQTVIELARKAGLIVDKVGVIASPFRVEC